MPQIKQTKMSQTTKGATQYKICLEKLKQQLSANGETLESLSRPSVKVEREEPGLSKQTINRIIYGQKVALRTLDKLCRRLGCEQVDLVFGVRRAAPQPILFKRFDFGLSGFCKAT